MRTWLLIGVAISIAGCSLTKRAGSIRTMARSKDHSKIRVAYRTDSDRVNLLSLGTPPGARQVAYRDSTAEAVANFSIGTLEIVYPHPAVGPDYAMATVVLRPTGNATALTSDSLLDQFSGSVEKGLGAQPILEKRSLAIPRWQLDSVIAKLQKTNFFRRSKTLGADAFLAVELNGTGFAKNYQAVPELDALIVRVCQQGQQATNGARFAGVSGPPSAGRVAPSGPPDLSRLPPVAQRSR